MNSNFVDLCSDIQQGEKYFARHPFKIYMIVEGKSEDGRYFLEMQYFEKEDLSEYSNKDKCKRIQNMRGNFQDDKVGSTILGRNGYGYPITMDYNTKPPSANDTNVPT